MATRNATSAARHAGFTLVEMMITVVILSILTSIAIPAYTSQIRKSRRTEARSALLDLASREERFFSTSNTYSSSPAALAYGAGTTWTAAPGMSVGSGYYTVFVAVTAAQPTATPPVPAGYTITATPAGSQSADAECATFVVDQTGNQTATGSGTNPSTNCWK
jgi:type IV pilus assembly protein PilE